jgi:1-acyl-sn-glycerol-3-phosphate acyltransferase
MASRPLATADKGWSPRAILRLAGLALLLAAYLGPHLVAKALHHGRSAWPRRFLRAAARGFGADVRLVGAPIRGRTMLLANHTSWLDILALGGATGCAFVSKHEIGQLPLVGWLADQNHTLYIDRSDRRGSHGQVQRIADKLDGTQPIALFPEGTTSDGRPVLPFRSTLLAAVAPAPSDVSVRPVAISYGGALEEVAWIAGEPGLSNVRRVLGRRGRIPLTIHLLDPLPPGEDRKAMARDAHLAISAALASATEVERL